MAFQQLPAKSAPNHPVILVEDMPMAVAKVREPARCDPVELFESLSHRLSRFARCQLADVVNHLAVTFRAWKTKLPAKRIAQKIEARLATVNDPRFLGMKRQASLIDKTLHFLKSRHGLFLTTSQDHKIVSIANHLVAQIGHPMIQFIEVQIR